MSHDKEREWAQQESERQEAIEEAAKALGIMKEYSIRIHYNKREDDSYSVELSSMEEAIDHAWSTREDLKDSEGSEIAYITEDACYDDETEVDMRRKGEPFSWQAVEFVKRLAVAETCSATAMSDWVHKAQALLKK